MTKFIVDIKLMASLALLCMATEVIIVHNHPSGNLNPSQNDKALTATVKDALKLIDVTLLDHWLLLRLDIILLVMRGCCDLLAKLLFI